MSSGLALRGCVILLTSCSQTSPAGNGGECTVLEYICRRQRRVVRSTFSGELNGLIDSVELLLVIQMCLHQIWNPGGSNEKAIDMARQLELGTLVPKAEAVVDARSVFDCLAATDVGELVEGSLKLHVLALRERLLSGTLSALWWTDTRDMLADGLTKGSVLRDQLLLACNQGIFKTIHQAAVTRCVEGKKVTAGPSIVRN